MGKRLVPLPGACLDGHAARVKEAHLVWVSSTMLTYPSDEYS